MRLSIIIPVYNVEAFVSKTLESVFNTTASADDFEVIVVNDGTKDKSMDVVRRFSDRPNLLILEQENQGLSAARMNGLSVASGEYIWFIDSDAEVYQKTEGIWIAADTKDQYLQLDNVRIRDTESRDPRDEEYGSGKAKIYVN